MSVLPSQPAPFGACWAQYAQARARKRVEEIFGWMKTVGGFRRSRYRGLDRTGLAGYLVATAYNLVRMAKLLVSQQEEAPVSAHVSCAPVTSLR